MHRHNGGAWSPDDVESADQGALAARSERALHRIADSLGVPVDAFRIMIALPKDMPTERDRRVTDDECREVLEAFRRIENPRVRRRCLAILRSLAEP